MVPAWSDIPIQVMISVFAVLNIIIDFGLLYLVFVSKSLPKSSNLTLFYFRFLIDGLFGVGTLLKSIPYFLDLFRVFQNPNQTFQVSLYLFSVDIALLRAFLVIIISLDRATAVFFPVFYRTSRSSISNKFLIVLVLCWPIVDHAILWGVCEFRLGFETVCTVFNCHACPCFTRYTMVYEVAAHSIIVLICLALAVKLFLWNWYKKDLKSKDIERANHLALIDAALIFTFDIIPALLSIVFSLFSIVIFGLIPLCKVMGYTVEGYLVYCTLKRKCAVAGNGSMAASNLSSPVARI